MLSAKVYLPPNSEVSKEGSGYFTRFITFEVVVEGGGAVVVVVVVVGSAIRLSIVIGAIEDNNGLEKIILIVEC